MTALLSLRALPDGAVAVAVARSGDDHYATVAPTTTLVVTLWHESAGIVRGRFDHPGSGAVAYFQSNDTLLAMAGALDLRFAR